MRLRSAMKRNITRSMLLACVATICIVLAATPAMASDCSDTDAQAADHAIDFLKSWNDVHRAFQRYHQCDDGAIWEGFSEGVTVLLARHWTQLGNLKKLCASDPMFLPFVLRHIDATADCDNLLKIMNNARNRRPHNSTVLCRRILQAARKALSEYAMPYAVDSLLDSVVRSRTWAQQQRLFDRIESLGCGAVPELVLFVDDTRPLPFHHIALSNNFPGAFEGIRHYGPSVLGQAVAAILNQLTARSFGFVLNEASESELKECARSWRDWLQSTPHDKLCP